MKFEKLKESNGSKYKMFLCGFIVAVVLIIIVNLFTSKAKYRTTVSIPIVNGTIKYSGGNADLNIIAINVQKEENNCTSDDCYDNIEEIPTKGYQLNEDKSYCTEPGNESQIKGNTTYTNKSLTINNMTKKGTKCYLYFDKVKTSSDVLANLGRTEATEPTNFAVADTTEYLDDDNKTKMFKTEDDFGDSYYFRGKVKDNWVQFGTDEKNQPMWWRIIRINGDGSIRLIYSGVGSNTSNLTKDGGYTGNESYSISSSSKFVDNDYKNSKYVGFFYGDGNLHTSNTTPSLAYTELEKWFGTNLLDEFIAKDSKIDINAGFCGDRSNSSTNSTTWSENMEDYYTTSGENTPYFGPLLRLYHNNPTYKCGTLNNKNNDYYTYEGAKGIQSKSGLIITGNKRLLYPVGLITSDEVVFAGGRRSNNAYYLYIGNECWTMSPRGYYDRESGVTVLSIDLDGGIGWNELTFYACIRPVINLKTGVTLTGRGILTNPYTVS